ncbi:hypothetical protein [Microcoleus sp. herbarium12]|uniref:hypothetical protein n=1 Tax=Microcoleus sp. herbarium12 TaxID=3055437 RepID=UPI002FCF3485
MQLAKLDTVTALVLRSSPKAAPDKKSDLSPYQLQRLPRIQQDLLEISKIFCSYLILQPLPLIVYLTAVRVSHFELYRTLQFMDVSLLQLGVN